MHNNNSELLDLSQEVKCLSDYIAMLKRKKNILSDGPEKLELDKEIKMRQHQALFYISKMDNINS